LTKIEKIKKYFTTRKQFTIENGMLTPTLKLKRYKIIEKYKKVTDTVLNLNVWSTITTLNILDTYTLFQFCREYELPVSFNLLNNPRQLNICLFNSKQKKYITDKLLNIQDDEFQKIIEPIMALMNNSNMSTDTTNMIDFLSVTDKIRKQDYKQTYEELTYIL
jgi:hypothetical protein